MAAPEGMRGQILLAAQEISFAKVLAGNDKPTRDRGLKRLRKWLTARSEGSLEFSEEDHLTLWKGLFYCMWMSDKPLVQEDLAEQISNLIHCFKKCHQGILFMKCFFQTMAREWFGIDQFRLDKFMMLVRRCARQLFTFCFNHGWTSKSCEEVCNLFESVLLNSADNAIGLVLHISDIILEELAKAGGGENVILYVIKPWAKLIGIHHDRRIRQHVVDRVFHHLIRQSNLGIEFQDKFDAWKEAGFPGNSWREMEAVEVDDGVEEDVNTESSNNGITLDPRAGKVDVELPQIMFEPEEVSNILHEEQSRAVQLRGRKTLHLLSSQFKQLSDGQYPLGFKKPPGFKQKIHKRKAEGELWDAAEDLLEYESKVKLSEKQHIEEDEKDELVQPTKKMKLKKFTVEGVLSKSKKKKLRMQQLKQKWNISNKVKSNLTNKSNSENLLGDTNCTTHKIKPAKKHQLHTKCVPEAKILCSMQVDSCNDEHKPVDSETLQVKKKRKSQEGKSPKLNVVTQKKGKKSPLKEMTSNNEIKLISTPSPKRKKNKITPGIESNISSADIVSPHLPDSGFNSNSTEGKILDNIQAYTCNEEQKPVLSVMLQPKQKRQSLEDRKSPKLSVQMLKKSKKSPLKEMTSSNESILKGSPSPKQKNKKVSSGIENGILSAVRVTPQLPDSGSNSTSIEGKILDSSQACNEQNPFVSVMQQPKSKRQSSEERKSPKQNIDKSKKSPLKEMTSDNELKRIGSPSPTIKNNTINNTDIGDNILSAVSACSHLHDSNSDVLVLEKDDMCTNLITPLKHKNSPVLIKEPINEASLRRRSLRIRTPVKTYSEQTPIVRSVKSRSSLSSTKSKKQRLSECDSETSFLGSQVGAILVQKFESSTGEGSKQTKRNSVNRRASVCDQQQMSLVSEPQSSEKTPVTSKVAKIKARKSTKNSTPQQNTSLQLEGSGKKVNIVLKKNMTQGFMEYEQAVRNSPDIPFDASKKPIQGVLKPTSVPSPLNPFYKLNKIKL